MRTARGYLLPLFVWAGCNADDPMPASGGNASSTDTAGADTDDIDGGQTSGGASPVCRVFDDVTPLRWETQSDEGTVVGVVGLDDGGVVLAFDVEARRYDAEGTPTQVYQPFGIVSGASAGLGQGEFALLSSGIQQLHLAEFEGAETLVEVVAYDVDAHPLGPPVRLDDGTVVTLTVANDSTQLHVRDGQFELVHTHAIDPAAYHRAAALSAQGSIYLATRAGDGTVIEAFGDASPLWSLDLPQRAGASGIRPPQMVVGSAVFAHAPAAIPRFVALAPGDGTLLWEDDAEYLGLVEGPCGDAMALLYEAEQLRLYDLGLQGATLVTVLETPTPEDATASIADMSFGPDGTLFLARSRPESGETILAAY